MQEKVLQRLKELQIEYDILTHPPVVTVAEAEQFWANLEGTHCKNLFLQDKKGKQHYLIVAEKDTPIDLKAFGQQFGNERFSFASERRLQKYLKLQRGAVSPFGVLNDEANHVILLIDSHLKNADRLGFHPNDNTATVLISFADLIRVIEYAQNSYQFVNF